MESVQEKSSVTTVIDVDDIGKVLAWAVTGKSVYGTGLLRPIVERLCRSALRDMS